MALKSTKDREIKIDTRTGIYYFRGTVRRGDQEIKRSLGVRTFNAAVFAKKELLNSLRGIDYSQKDIPFHRYAREVYLPLQAKKTKSTSDKAVSAIKQLMPFFEHYSMRQITDTAWEEYKTYFEQRHRGHQLVPARLALVFMLTRLQKEGHIQKIPELAVPKYQKADKRVFTAEEIQKLYAAANPNFKGLILMMYKMGFRPGEPLNLTWDRVDFTQNTIKLLDEHTKTRVGRTVVMNQAVREWLLAQDKTKSKFVFQSTKSSGREMPLKSTNKSWANMCERLNIPAPNNLYCLRHTFLTEAGLRVNSGKLSLMLVCKFAGTSLETFEKHYMHVDGNQTKAVAELMDIEAAI